jgi:hypothetical protein
MSQPVQYFVDLEFKFTHQGFNESEISQICILERGSRVPVLNVTNFHQLPADVQLGWYEVFVSILSNNIWIGCGTTVDEQLIARELKARNLKLKCEVLDIQHLDIDFTIANYQLPSLHYLCTPLMATRCELQESLNSS